MNEEEMEDDEVKVVDMTNGNESSARRTTGCDEEQRESRENDADKVMTL